ncbi:RNA polymerase sigma factor [Sorangium sp. So ce388]|uniref:RNA polymerase sigma factor n=1 Tax=unclassified Sorangium TaxID=2621164 RepID=UPI003F5BE7C3
MPSPDLASSNLAEALRPLSCEQRSDAPPPAVASGRPADAAPAAPSASRSIDSVEALYRRHHRLVHRLALRYGKGNLAWAEDVTQDVFLDLFKALPTLTDHDDLEGWLYRATTNRCFNRLRRERFLSLAPVRWLLGEQPQEPRPPDALAIARDDLRRAFDALNALPVKERVAFSMYYLDGKEQEEIGRVLGHSKGYVCKLIQRAVQHLGGAGWKVDHGDV